MSGRVLAAFIALGIAVVGLSAALVVVLATDDDEGADTTPAAIHQMAMDDDFVGMMGAMADMDSDAMLRHMRAILGEDAYGQMLAHMQEHQSGGPTTGDPDIDAMMHSLMDGMMQHMPEDAGGNMPSGMDDHHQTLPSGTATATPSATTTTD
jgi:hypothetical protein